MRGYQTTFKNSKISLGDHHRFAGLSQLKLYGLKNQTARVALLHVNVPVPFARVRMMLQTDS
jgi:hypothetical protein